MREFQLLRQIYQENVRLPANILLPPGDDMAAIQIGQERILAAVDQLVGGRHVDLAKATLEQVGYKAIARSVSDIAAMAAEPVASLVAVTLPPDFGEERAMQLFQSMREAASQLHVPLIGGDIAVHMSSDHPLVCSVTVLARVPDDGGRIVTRQGAKVGDAVYVTGSLGGAYKSDGQGKHLTFTPRVQEALQLSTMLGADLHAMIDISDGLGRDASHIAEDSSVAIELDSWAIPCHAGEDFERALNDGEDYELCFTSSQRPPDVVCGTAVTAVGRVVDANERDVPVGSVLLKLLDGATRDVRESGWEHH